MGRNPATNVIDYVTIASTGNATDFGDLLANTFGKAATSDAVTAVASGGYTTGAINTIESITIATTGNSADFGDATQSVYGAGACSNSHGGLA